MNGIFILPIPRRFLAFSCLEPILARQFPLFIGDPLTQGRLLSSLLDALKIEYSLFFLLLN
jgi:hypothetical protein